MKVATGTGSSKSTRALLVLRRMELDSNNGRRLLPVVEGGDRLCVCDAAREPGGFANGPLLFMVDMNRSRVQHRHAMCGHSSLPLLENGHLFRTVVVSVR